MKMKTYCIAFMLAVFSISCEYGRQAEEKLKNIITQVEELDAVMNEGIENVTNLDSILPETSKKLKETDSIINDAFAALDSLNQKVKDIENNYQ